jgi:hypothetical protein
VLHFIMLAKVATKVVQLAGSLPPQQPPKSFAQNLDILMSGSVTAEGGHSTAGEKADRRRVRAAELAAGPGALLRVRIGCRMS